MAEGGPPGDPVVVNPEPAFNLERFSVHGLNQVIHPVRNIIVSLLAVDGGIRNDNAPLTWKQPAGGQF